MKGLVIGVVFTAIYLLLAFAASGAGHGTALFFAVIFPYGLGLLLFPLIGFLTDNLDSFLTKTLLLVVLAIHYGLVFTFIKMIWVEDFSYFEKVWSLSPIMIILPLGFYLLGNLIVFVTFISSLQNSQEQSFGT